MHLVFVSWVSFVVDFAQIFFFFLVDSRRRITRKDIKILLRFWLSSILYKKNHARDFERDVSFHSLIRAFKSFDILKRNLNFLGSCFSSN